MGRCRIMTKSFEEIQQIVDGLGYDFNHFHLGPFIKLISQHTGRKILVKDWKFSDRELHAMAYRGHGMDFIFYNTLLYPIHQMHAILHELGHLLLKHKFFDISVLEQLKSSELPIQADMPLTLRARWFQSPYPKQEEEAENFAYAVQKRVRHLARENKLYRSVSTIPTFKPYSDGMGFEG